MKGKRNNKQDLHQLYPPLSIIIKTYDLVILKMLSLRP